MVRHSVKMVHVKQEGPSGAAYSSISLSLRFSAAVSLGQLAREQGNEPTGHPRRVS